jgi:hypothetical protein
VERRVAERQQPALADAQHVDRRGVVTLADDVDESVHVGVDEIAEVVELIRRRRVAPVGDVNLAAGLDQILQKRAIVLQIEHIPVPDHCVCHQHGSLCTP